jgi:hypothetical protein
MFATHKKTQPMIINLKKGRFMYGATQGMYVLVTDMDGTGFCYEFKTLDKMILLITDHATLKNDSIDVIIPIDWEFEPFKTWIENYNN